ncbi:Oidioi.mRNA.OKI2018_I69.chr1.g996.t1.cds [Oikopleura dioica]|uniref:Oidioi.mRNA.OKI2018_I69.chr1.g996.t1.cds n=1 Tax=Oikopleura dioica TaxID=34765 RepID=A0ABN7SVT9_OIKDI|nr:Oidioi.mRNA.OKI2018_I69.chr1.g996.t1.cds [Oikopleura dioica]
MVQERATVYSESFVTENTPENFYVNRPELSKENYRNLLDENLRLKSSEKHQRKRSNRIICVLSTFIVITTSILLTIFILKSDEIFQSCDSSNQFISDSMREMKQLHQRTHELSSDLMDLIYAHEINSGIWNKEILNQEMASFSR